MKATEQWGFDASRAVPDLSLTDRPYGAPEVLMVATMSLCPVVVGNCHPAIRPK
jgi:hypothetical protein